MTSAAVASEPPRILVVEDQGDLAEALALNLEHLGYAVECVRDGRHALMAARARAPHLVLLDLGLPRLDGFGVLAQLRADGIWCPVLILTARSAAADKVEGFRLGADDYVTKPFTLEELLGRVRALLRRATQDPPPPTGETRRESPTTAVESAPHTGALPDVIGYTDEELVTRFGLTLRQAKVTRLLGEGFTNAEIATKLEMSYYTARNHTEQVLAKLGVSSRAAVGALLYGQG